MVWWVYRKVYNITWKRRRDFDIVLYIPTAYTIVVARILLFSVLENPAGRKGEFCGSRVGRSSRSRNLDPAVFLMQCVLACYATLCSELKLEVEAESIEIGEMR